MADLPSKTESLADLLREARRDWITDTEWVGDHYGCVMQPRGEAVRAFGARIDAALQGETPADPTGNWPATVFTPLPPDEAQGLRDYGVDDSGDLPETRAESRRVESVLDFKVTVCSECLQASCWLGEFYCEQHREASTVIKTVRELHALGPLEDAGWWFKSADTGTVNYQFLEAYRSAVKTGAEP